jgi:hypothetical protein
MNEFGLWAMNESSYEFLFNEGSQKYSQESLSVAENHAKSMNFYNIYYLFINLYFCKV